MKIDNAILIWGSSFERADIFFSALEHFFHKSSYTIPHSIKSNFINIFDYGDTANTRFVCGRISDTISFTVSPSAPYSANGKLIDMLLDNNDKSACSQIKIWLSDYSDKPIADVYSGSVLKKMLV